ncbi:maleylpyruvate isomerase family mycothiol-dependent enzyme [Cryptosporangium aurantiacum]|uniref:TIGR03083 family protein n=1 Tax=Cryptosporangium aurantiacum TaxID=134849 RepID=A0A1M7R2M5_9ACTN|nr:maleylpyruvate isomerase family mycothiol-dependent enzyme [Cryptosporangium aurantiacum]SHN38899.1 TIGR03083 family protein [Cryptosporangium aurantiacum]
MNDHLDADGSLRLLSDVAELAAERPAPRVRQGVLARIRALTAELPVPSEAPTAAEPYAAQVAGLDALLARAPEEQWRTPTVTGWDVAGLVAHLTAVDAIAAETLGLPIPPELGAGPDVELRTQVVQRAYADRPPADLHRAWRGQAITLLRWASANADRLETTVPYFGLPLTRAEVLADRGVETWIHAEDVRTAWGTSLLPPTGAQVSVLTGAGMRVLATVWGGLNVSDGVLVHLTGAGGGDWLLDPGGTAAPAGHGPFGAEISLDALEFCYLVVGRRSADDVAHAADGDRALAASVLTTAALLARL